MKLLDYLKSLNLTEEQLKQATDAYTQELQLSVDKALKNTVKSEDFKKVSDELNLLKSENEITNLLKDTPSDLKDLFKAQLLTSKDKNKTLGELNTKYQSLIDKLKDDSNTNTTDFGKQINQDKANNGVVEDAFKEHEENGVPHL